jgi:hypothetical protein
MARLIRHASEVKPISIPVVNAVAPINWDNVQTFSPATSQPKEDIYQLGQATKIATAKQILEATLSMTQLEHGEIKEFLQLAGKSVEPGAGISITDFNSTLTDFVLPGKETFEGDLEQTLWMQKMVLDSFGLSLNAEERIERSYEFSGSNAKILRYDNVALIFKSDTAGSGVSGSYVITLTDPAPVENPNVADMFILQLYRIRAGVATRLVDGVDYSYLATNLTITDADEADVYRIWYSATTYGSASDMQVARASINPYIVANNVTVDIDDGVNSLVVLDKLTTMSLTASLNRIDEGVIGSSEKILKEVQSYEVSLSVTSFVKLSEIEEVFMQQAGQDWGIIDFSLFEDVDVAVKIYDEATKETFKIGYKMTGLEFSDNSESYNANEFGEVTLNMSTDNLVISTNIANM